MTAEAQGFATTSQTVDVRSAVPVDAPLTLSVAGSSTAVQVNADANLIESDPAAHQDVDRSALLRLPSVDPAAGLSQAITYSTGGVAADGNGFFHPLGDHAQVSFVIDGQPISDQQSKVFSTQLPVNAVQSMELMTGSPDAEFGDKTSLVAQCHDAFRPGNGAALFGNVDLTYGSLRHRGGSVGIGFGSAKVGNFLAVGRHPERPVSGHSRVHPLSRHGQQRDHLRPSRLAAGRRRTLCTSTCSPRATGSRSPTTTTSCRRISTSACSPGTSPRATSTPSTPHPADHQSVHPQGRVHLLRAAAIRSPIRPPRRTQSRQLLNWGVRSDLSPDRRPAQSQDRNRSEADAIAREFRLRHHRPELQPHLRGWQRAAPPGPSSAD